MGHKERKGRSKDANGSNAGEPSIFAGNAELDPALASLFSTSVSRTRLPLSEIVGANCDQMPSSKTSSVPEKPVELEPTEKQQVETIARQQDDEVPVEASEDEEDVNPEVLMPVFNTRPSSELRSRKRKRQDENEDLEALYMQQLAGEDAKERAKERKQLSNKRHKSLADDAEAPDGGPREDAEDDAVSQGESDEEQGNAEAVDIPQHETLTLGKSPELEKSNRTVFLGNVSTQAITSKAAKKTLLEHLSSFLDSLPTQDSKHKIESIRFRSTAFDIKIPKKAAFARKELMDATTKSTNAYVVYTTQLAAREAVKRLNGTIVLDRHLRVDSVAHPAKIDHRRCVFVGNLDFVDDDSQIREANEEERRGKKKDKKPADVEEGLWRQFGTAGTVESVRVVRDSKTRVGKGFAYVQFTDENAVEAALLFNDKKFPPLLPRKIRVVRAKSMKRNASKRLPGRGKPMDQESKSMQGRAGKLLGRAGAANFKKGDIKSPKLTTFKPPEAFVFEGHRASSAQGTTGLKLGGSGKRKDRSRSRSSKRAAAWKAAGGKKKAAN